MSNNAEKLIKILKCVFRRRRAALALRGLAVALTFLFFLLLMLTSLDYLFQLPWQIRMFSSLAGGFVWVVAFYKVFLQFVFVRFDPVKIAWLLEREYPELEERAVSAVEWYLATPSGVSQQWMDQVTEQAIAMVDQKAWYQLYPTPFRVFWIPLLLGCLIGLLSAFPQIQALLLFERVIFPSSRNPSLGNLQLTVLEPEQDDVFAEGDDVRIVVSATQPGLKNVELMVQSDQIYGRRMQQDSTPGSYTATLENVSGGMLIWARSGNTKSRTVRVNVMERPRIEDVVLRLAYPSYLKRQEEVMQQPPDQISLLADTVVEATLTVSEPVEDVQVMALGQSLEPYINAQEQELRFAFSVERSGRCSVAFQDRDGFAPAAPFQFDIEVIPDEPPELTALQPDDDISVEPYQQVSLEWRASDDFGIAAQQLNLHYGGRDQPQGEVIDLGPEVREYRLSLEEWEVQTGQLMSMQIKAVDNKEQVAESERRFLLVGKGRDLRALQRYMRGLMQLKRQLEKLYVRLSEIKDIHVLLQFDGQQDNVGAGTTYYSKMFRSACQSFTSELPAIRAINRRLQGLTVFKEAWLSAVLLEMDCTYLELFGMQRLKKDARKEELREIEQRLNQWTRLINRLKSHALSLLRLNKLPLVLNGLSTEMISSRDQIRVRLTFLKQQSALADVIDDQLIESWEARLDGDEELKPLVSVMKQRLEIVQEKAENTLRNTEPLDNEIKGFLASRNEFVAALKHLSVDGAVFDLEDGPNTVRRIAGHWYNPTRPFLTRWQQYAFEQLGRALLQLFETESLDDLDALVTPYETATALKFLRGIVVQMEEVMLLSEHLVTTTQTPVGSEGDGGATEREAKISYSQLFRQIKGAFERLHALAWGVTVITQESADLRRLRETLSKIQQLSNRYLSETTGLHPKTGSDKIDSLTQSTMKALEVLVQNCEKRQRELRLKFQNAFPQGYQQNYAMLEQLNEARNIARTLSNELSDDNFSTTRSIERTQRIDALLNAVVTNLRLNALELTSAGIENFGGKVENKLAVARFLADIKAEGTEKIVRLLDQSRVKQGKKDSEKDEAVLKGVRDTLVDVVYKLNDGSDRLQEHLKLERGLLDWDEFEKRLAASEDAAVISREARFLVKRNHILNKLQQFVQLSRRQGIDEGDIAATGELFKRMPGVNGVEQVVIFAFDRTTQLLMQLYEIERVLYAAPDSSEMGVANRKDALDKLLKVIEGLENVTGVFGEASRRVAAEYVYTPLRQKCEALKATIKRGKTIDAQKWHVLKTRLQEMEFKGHLLQEQLLYSCYNYRLDKKNIRFNSSAERSAAIFLINSCGQLLLQITQIEALSARVELLQSDYVQAKMQILNLVDQVGLENPKGKARRMAVQFQENEWSGAAEFEESVKAFADKLAPKQPILASRIRQRSEKLLGEAVANYNAANICRKYMTKLRLRVTESLKELRLIETPGNLAFASYVNERLERAGDALKGNRFRYALDLMQNLKQDVVNHVELQRPKNHDRLVLEKGGFLVLPQQLQSRQQELSLPKRMMVSADSFGIPALRASIAQRMAFRSMTGEPALFARLRQWEKQMIEKQAESVTIVTSANAKYWADRATKQDSLLTELAEVKEQDKWPRLFSDPDHTEMEQQFTDESTPTLWNKHPVQLLERYDEILNETLNKLVVTKQKHSADSRSFYNGIMGEEASVLNLEALREMTGAVSFPLGKLYREFEQTAADQLKHRTQLADRIIARMRAYQRFVKGFLNVLQWEAQLKEHIDGCQRIFDNLERLGEVEQFSVIQNLVERLEKRLTTENSRAKKAPEELMDILEGRHWKRFNRVPELLQAYLDDLSDASKQFSDLRRLHAEIKEELNRRGELLRELVVFQSILVRIDGVSEKLRQLLKGRRSFLAEDARVYTRFLQNAREPQTVKQALMEQVALLRELLVRNKVRLTLPWEMLELADLFDKAGLNALSLLLKKGLWEEVEVRLQNEQMKLDEVQTQFVTEARQMYQQQLGRLRVDLPLPLWRALQEFLRRTASFRQSSPDHARWIDQIRSSLLAGQLETTSALLDRMLWFDSQPALVTTAEHLLNMLHEFREKRHERLQALPIAVEMALKTFERKGAVAQPYVTASSLEVERALLKGDLQSLIRALQERYILNFDGEKKLLEDALASLENEFGAFVTQRVAAPRVSIGFLRELSDKQLAFARVKAFELPQMIGGNSLKPEQKALFDHFNALFNEVRIPSQQRVWHKTAQLVAQTSKRGKHEDFEKLQVFMQRLEQNEFTLARRVLEEISTTLLCSPALIEHLTRAEQLKAQQSMLLDKVQGNCQNGKLSRAIVWARYLDKEKGVQKGIKELQKSRMKVYQACVSQIGKNTPITSMTPQYLRLLENIFKHDFESVLRLMEKQAGVFNETVRALRQLQKQEKQLRLELKGMAANLQQQVQDTIESLLVEMQQSRVRYTQQLELLQTEKNEAADVIEVVASILEQLRENKIAASFEMLEVNTHRLKEYADGLLKTVSELSETEAEARELWNPLMGRDWSILLKADGQLRRFRSRLVTLCSELLTNASNEKEQLSDRYEQLEGEVMLLEKAREMFNNNQLERGFAIVRDWGTRQLLVQQIDQIMRLAGEELVDYAVECGERLFRRKQMMAKGEWYKVRYSPLIDWKQQRSPEIEPRSGSNQQIDLRFHLFSDTMHKRVQDVFMQTALAFVGGGYTNENNSASSPKNITKLPLTFEKRMSVMMLRLYLNGLQARMLQAGQMDAVMGPEKLSVQALLEEDSVMVRWQTIDRLISEGVNTEPANEYSPWFRSAIQEYMKRLAAESKQ